MNVIDNTYAIMKLQRKLGINTFKAQTRFNTIHRLANYVLEGNIIKATFTELARREGLSKQNFHKMIKYRNKDIICVDSRTRADYTIYTHPAYYFVGSAEQQKEALIHWYQMNDYRDGSKDPFLLDEFRKAWFDLYPDGVAYQYQI